MNRRAVLIFTVLGFGGTIAGLAWASMNSARQVDLASAPSSVKSLDPELGAEISDGCSKLTTVDDARRDLPFELLVPETERASEQNLSKIAECGQDAVKMTFSSGITIGMRVSHLEDPDEALQAAADQVHNDGEPEGITTVGTVNGAPALFSDPYADPKGEVLGGLLIVDSGVEIAIVGTGEISLDDLTKVAESLKPASDEA